jgi:ATP-binding cassette subfamily B multidrug efflux pump
MSRTPGLAWSVRFFLNEVDKDEYPEIIEAMHWFYEDEFLPAEEERPRRRNWGLIKKLLPYFRKYLRIIIIAAILLVASTLLALLGPILIKHAIDVEIPNKNLQGIFTIALIYLVVQVFIIIVRYFQQIEVMTVGEKAIADLKSDLFFQLVNMPVEYFDKNPTGRLISRIESDTETLKYLFSATAVVLIRNLSLIVGMSVVMIVVNYKLYLLILILLPIFLYCFWWFQRHVRPVYLSVRRTIAEINGFIIEAIRGLHIVQAFVQEPRFVSHLHDLGKDKYEYEIKALNYWYRIWFFVELGEIIGIILVLGIGGLWALQGLITIGSLYLFISYITRLFVPLRGLSDQINLLERSFASAERIFKILASQREETDKATKRLPAFRDRITFKDLGYYYEEGKWVLKNIHFTIRKGDRIALVGETGGGKTSIVSLLLKFYTPKQGAILIDGIPITEIERHSLRTKIGFVPQDVILFPGSIMNNLRLFNNSISEEQVVSSAQRAHIHDRIQDLPDGYDTNIVEQGINLSFGERQLLSYARALVFDPDILILDEATSSVDPESERLVQQGLKELLKDRTAIIIAHRLTTTRLADRIVVIHQGKLVEQGTHDELIRRQGYYYAMHQLQYINEAS